MDKNKNVLKMIVYKFSKFERNQSLYYNYTRKAEMETILNNQVKIFLPKELCGQDMCQ